MFKNILVISTTGIGDTLIGTPAIRALRKSFPKASIEAIVNHKRLGIFRDNPYLNKVYSYRNNSFFRILLALTLRKKAFDIVIILHANDFLGLLRLIKYKRAINLQGYNDKNLNLVSYDLSFNMHAVERKLRLVEGIGADRKNGVKLDLFLNEKDHFQAQRALNRHGIVDNDIVIGFQLGAAKAYKCWPVSNFAQLARYIIDTYHAKIIVNGIKKEGRLFTQFQKLTQRNDIFFISGLSIKESAAVIKRCKLFITNDTGPMHMAFAVETPSICLFVPSDPSTIGPYGYGDLHKVIKKNPICSPCITKKCENPVCMEQIRVDEVKELVDQMIASIDEGKACRTVEKCLM